MPVNWRVGLHRVLIVTCVAWVLLLLVVLPFVEVARQRDFAAQFEAMAAAYPEGSASRDRTCARLWQEATLSYFYREEMLGHWPLWLIALAGPSSLIYAKD